MNQSQTHSWVVLFGVNLFSHQQENSRKSWSATYQALVRLLIIRGRIILARHIFIFPIWRPKARTFKSYCIPSWLRRFPCFLSFLWRMLQCYLELHCSPRLFLSNHGQCSRKVRIIVDSVFKLLILWSHVWAIVLFNVMHLHVMKTTQSIDCFLC